MTQGADALHLLVGEGAVPCQHLFHDVVSVESDLLLPAAADDVHAAAPGMWDGAESRPQVLCGFHPRVVQVLVVDKRHLQAKLLLLDVSHI